MTLTIIQGSNMLDMIEIEPESEACSSVIWLHGLGADGHDFEPLVRKWGLVDAMAVRFILPHAPVQPVTLNGGMRMRAWYDLYGLDSNSKEDTEGIEQARQTLLGLIAREQQRGIASEHILLAGFSQGGALALHTALRWNEPLAGVLVLSGYLPVPHCLATEKRLNPESLVLRMDHGEQDPVVPYGVAQASRELLQAEGFTVDFHSYAMEHNLCPDQIDSLQTWMRRRLQTARA